MMKLNVEKVEEFVWVSFTIDRFRSGCREDVAERKTGGEEGGGGNDGWNLGATLGENGFLPREPNGRRVAIFVREEA